MYYQLFNDTKKYNFSNINIIENLNNKSNIKALNFYSNPLLTTLPKLPSNLKILYCPNNQLTELPELPSTL